MKTSRRTITKLKRAIENNDKEIMLSLLKKLETVNWSLHTFMFQEECEDIIEKAENKLVGFRNNTQNIDTLDEAYHKGHIAYHDGYTLKYNPYKRHTEEWEEWRSGWNDEKSDDPYWEKHKRTHNKFKQTGRNEEF